MNTTQTPSTASGSLAMPGSPRRWCYVLTAAAVFAATIALFYTEENWRGRRAWENCKRELEAKGAVLDWPAFMAPPVPEDQNVFAVPEMKQWFTGRPTTLPQTLPRPGQTELSEILHYPGYTNSLRLVLANVTVGLPSATLPSGFTALHWSDGTNAQAEATRLMKEALGPVGEDPIGFAIMAKRPQEVRPAQIFLQCQTAPTAKELEQFFPKDLLPGSGPHTQAEVRVEPTGRNSYNVSMAGLLSAADYAAWGDSIEPEIAVIRQAVRRPDARLEGDYRDFINVPIQNGVSFRIISQRLAALAESRMLLGQPEKALEELTFLQQVHRVLEFRPGGKPMPLVTAMLNVAIAGLYVSHVEDGLRLQVWKEPQLTALQQQLTEINLPPCVAQAFSFERAGIIRTVEVTPKAGLGRILWAGHNDTNFLGLLIPQGWIDQNLVVFANVYQPVIESLPPDRQDIEPQRITAMAGEIEVVVTNPSPFNLLARIAIPNVARASRNMAYNQTRVIQARIACALERYRLARGEYPATLDALLPQFIEKIPFDPIGGQPPHYRRTDDGKFLLYSIGWSEKDHGGQPGKDGDWVCGDTSY